MGALCCCFHVPDEEDNNRSNNASSNYSLYPKWFLQKFINKHRTGQMHAILPPNQQAASSSGVVLNNISSDASGSRNIASRSRVQPEPIGRSDIRVNQKSNKGSQEQSSEYSTKVFSSGVENEIENMISSSDDEDACPTCFEEYTEENPKIIMKCSHHYHLGCIYEWMERSENCPVCRRLMLFDESS